MIALDTSFLLDYLDGVDATADFLEANEEKPFYAPSLVLFEVYRGATRTGGADELDAVRLDSPGSIGSRSTTQQPKRLRSSKQNSSVLARQSISDALITGICRQHGARIVTRDEHLERVDGLSVETY